MRANEFVRSALIVAGAMLVMTLVSPSPAQAQFKKLKERAASAVSEEAAKKVGQEVAVGDVPAGAEGAPAGAPGEMAAETPGATPAEADAMSPGEGPWANYDFVPGEIPLFVEDFSNDRVGNFPRRLEFVEGNLEIVEWQGRRFLRATTYPATFAIVLEQPLPEKYTLEFEFLPIVPYGWSQYVYFTGLDQQPNSVVCGIHQAGLAGDANGKGKSLVTLDGSLDQQVYPCRILVDGDYAKVYQNEQRVANVPNAALGHGPRLTFRFAAAVESPVMIGNIRLMGGGRDLYDALEAEGRVATRGILFDSGSDRIRPESTPTLTEIGEMLAAHPELRLAIEGHTDSDGDDAANQSLSDRRAAAVKAYLVGSHGIEEGRLETAGFGESKPVTDNATSEGKAQNRRVELVKLS